MGLSKWEKPKACLICGYDRHVTKHHIKPKRDGYKLTRLNTLYVCPNCHYECDHGRHPQEYQQKIVISYWENLGYTLEELQKEEAESIERIKSENEKNPVKPPTSKSAQPDHSQNGSSGQRDSCAAEGR